MSEGSCGSDAGALASRVSRARLLKRCEEDLVLAQAMEMAHAEAVHAGSGPAAFPSPILVTGSSGLLGAALVTVLRGVGVSVRGLDVLAAGTTDVQGSVADAAVVERAVQGCKAIFHTASLHHPDDDTFSESDFVRINVHGTQLLLDAAARAGCQAFVYTSTTSLMVTEAAKETMARGECFWADEREPTGPPRNKYGRTKLAAERLCLGQAVCPVVVLRPSRFFAEELREPTAGLSLPNDKANELLGRRVALRDVVDGHLRALKRLPAVSGRVFILAAPTGLRREDLPRLPDASWLLEERVPAAAAAFAQAAWRLPAAVPRVYDSSAALDEEQGLGWRPEWTFASLVARMASGDEWARLGAY